MNSQFFDRSVSSVLSASSVDRCPLRPGARRREYQTVIAAVVLLGAAAARSQTNAPAPAVPPAPAVTAAGTGGLTNATRLEAITVVGGVEEVRTQIPLDLGTSAYTINEQQLQALPSGENGGFNQLLLRAPGVAADSLGQVHVRGEHANLQYRINDIVLPEGITGFGQELDPRFMESLRFITGSLPAEYGLRTAGVVDIQTKSGSFDQGGTATVYGGAYDTFSPSFAYGGSEGKLNYFFDGGYNHNNLGIENPAPGTTPLHDLTEQYKTFGYLSYKLDDTSRLGLLYSASYGGFEVPNRPGLAGTYAGAPGAPSYFDSAQLNERQYEKNYYGVLAYTKTFADANLQIAGFGRDSSVHFRPDTIGDLYFNGVASDVNRGLDTGGFQADFTDHLGETHTLRAGLAATQSTASDKNQSTVWDLSALGVPTGQQVIRDQETLHATTFSAYVQDSWKLTPKVTVNYGARFDIFDSYVTESQISPRLNLVYQPVTSTTLHAGYARYFTPPPLELVRSGSVAQFNGTANASQVTTDDPVKAERAHYFDAGVTQDLAPGLKVGVDAYYKVSKDQLDDGLFGQTLILAPFNFEKGEVRGVEFTASYTDKGFSTFANVAVSKAQGRNVVASQFLFSQAALNYIQGNYIPLDHDQTVTGSFGASYKFEESRSANTLVFVDALFGSGLRTDGAPLPADPSVGIPNGGSVPVYSSVNVGVQQELQLSQRTKLRARLDIVNVSDNVYELRDGSGVGVNAPQYGQRRGFYGTLSFLF